MDPSNINHPCQWSVLNFPKIRLRAGMPDHPFFLPRLSQFDQLNQIDHHSVPFPDIPIGFQERENDRFRSCTFLVRNDLSMALVSLLKFDFLENFGMPILLQKQIQIHKQTTVLGPRGYSLAHYREVTAQ